MASLRQSACPSLICVSRVIFRFPCCGMRDNVRFRVPSAPKAFFMTADQLKDLIAAGLPCEHIALEGDGRHWFATIVSAQFEGQRLLGRQRLVYATLGNRMATDEVHALSMKTYTPAEWAAAQA